VNFFGSERKIERVKLVYGTRVMWCYCGRRRCSSFTYVARDWTARAAEAEEESLAAHAQNCQCGRRDDTALLRSTCCVAMTAFSAITHKQRQYQRTKWVTLSPPC